MTAQLAVATTQLTRKFGRLTAVDHVDLAIPLSCIYGFLGPNGSGKTTIIRMLCGLLKPSEGTARVLGYAMPAEAEALRRKAGYMTQKFSLYDDLTVIENLDFVGRIYGLRGIELDKCIRALMEEFNLSQIEDQLVGTMSGGERQRLALAAATLHDPEILFLDEPTGGVDPQSRRDFWDTLFNLSDRGTTILVSTHYMDEAERCHGLAILDRGVLVADDSPRNLVSDIDATVLKLKSEKNSAARNCLINLPEVLSAAQVGEQLRVLVKRHVPEPIALLAARLDQQGLSADISVTEPNLEDVFVVTTRKTKSA